MTLVEMLVVLAIVAILGVALAVPDMGLAGRRREAAAERLELALAQALRRSRAGEPWRLAWQPASLQLERTDQPSLVPLALPEDLTIASLRADGQPWPPGRFLSLAGFATPLLRLELVGPGGQLLLRTLPTGRVERPGSGAP
jgi:prepilin-type N-terminal cleavage/methylation domain-containing protein